MALEGMRFTQWYSGGPLCTPSRGALLTGRLPIRLGLYTAFNYPADLAFRVFLPTSTGSLPANETTLPTLLSEAGYYSALLGKWHLGHVDSLPTRRGFDYFFGVPYSHDEGFPGAYPLDTVFPPVPVYENELLVEQPVVLSTLTGRMTERALDLLTERAADGQPFLLVMSYLQPHIPEFSSPEFEGVSRRGHFGDMMEEMDASIGLIMARIKELGLDNNTLTMFTSDNGAWPNAQEPLTEADGMQPAGGSNGPLREGKGSTWEGGMREPTIVRWPGVIPPNKISMEIASHLDIVPTLLDFAEVDVPSDLIIDGKSIVPLLVGDTDVGPHEYFFYWRESNLTAVRYGPWKAHFVTRPGFGTDEPVYYDPPLIFNLEHDPGESFPVNASSIPDIVATILAAADSHKATITRGIPQYETGEGTPIPGNDWRQVPCCDQEAFQNMSTRELIESQWAVCFCNDPKAMERRAARLPKWSNMTDGDLINLTYRSMIAADK